MNLTFSGRHMDMTEGLKSHVEDHLGKVTAHFDKVIDVDVILDVQKLNHIAEINLRANGVRIHSKESSEDMYASVDACIAKLDRQVRKYKDRINRHQPRSAREARFYNHALLSLDGGNGNADTETETDSHREVHREQLSMTPMTVSDAVMHLELVNDLFLVFWNADTAQVNVLYKHSDGTLGLIEPQF